LARRIPQSLQLRHCQLPPGSFWHGVEYTLLSNLERVIVEVATASVVRRADEKIGGAEERNVGDRDKEAVAYPHGSASAGPA
jgi:hypothetical protein